MSSMTSSNCSAIVISMAETFIGFLHDQIPNWTRGFYRFEKNNLMHGANSSYVAGDDVFLVDVFEHSEFCDHMSFLAEELWTQYDQGTSKFCVMLLSVDSDRNYNIDFEHTDSKRWRISKLNGASGLPNGIA